MKKITLLVLFILSTSLFVLGQNLQSEDFDALSIGNVGTDINGALSGQNGWFTLATGGGLNTDFQITNEGGQGLVLQITGASNDSSAHFLWQNGLNSAWSARTVGNDIIEVEYDFYTGAATSSLSETGMRLYNSDYSIVIGGYSFEPQTMALNGLAYFDPGPGPDPVGLYLINLGAPEIILSPNTWYRVGFSFNKTTGECIWKGPGYYGALNGAATGIDPFEVDFAVIPFEFNMVSPVAKFDALTVKATNTEELLSLASDLENSLSTSIKLFPNPTKDILNLRASHGVNLTKLEVIDVNGRLVRSIPINGISNKSINISELTSGFYLINIHSMQGKITKKFIKE